MPIQRQPPDVPALVRVLAAHRTAYVVTGSTAAMLHGVELTPGDLDIVPALDVANLERLAGALAAIDARPDPDPSDPATFDELLDSRLGALDIVPVISGRYEDLVARASRVRAFGEVVAVASIGDLLAALAGAERPKDRDRLRALRAIRDRG